MWSLTTSARRIPDAIIAKAAEASGVDYIATFDERMSSPGVPVRLI
jgi:predicted nucleic acid-binding protein